MTRRRARSTRIVGSLLGLSLCTGSASAQLTITTDESDWLTQFGFVDSITFDDVPPGPLTTQYAGLTFDGFDPGTPGYALGVPRISHASTGFNLDPVHGDKPTEPGCLLTSSNGLPGHGGDGWQVSFDVPIAGFCLKTGGLQDPSTFLDPSLPPTLVELFDTAGDSLGQFDLFDETASEYTTVGRDWGTVCVTAPDEIIQRVEFSVSNGDYVAFDDLQVGWVLACCDPCEIASLLRPVIPSASAALSSTDPCFTAEVPAEPSPGCCDAISAILPSLPVASSHPCFLQSSSP